MEEVKIEEIGRRKKGRPRVAILTYIGDGDPCRLLDKTIQEYTHGKNYKEFIDMNMDNPWVRTIIFGEV
jgi:hypothetical protein